MKRLKDYILVTVDNEEENLANASVWESPNHSAKLTFTKVKIFFQLVIRILPVIIFQCKL